MITTQPITRDLDDSRINDNPCVVASPLGQLFIFYSKTWYTGKQSYSRIKYTPPFSISVEAGNGVINGVEVSWNAATLTASPEEYQLVYVTPDSEVHIRSNITMTEMRTIIPLAYVKSGLLSIAQLEELEWTGRYIFLRKQVYIGSEWVWDDYEYRLNTGEQPRAFYDAVNDKIYLSYKKDSIAYNRMLDPIDDTTWEYLTSISIVINDIFLNRDPQNSTVLSIGAGNKIAGNLSSDEYPIGTTGFCFVGNQVYIFLPHIGGNYLQDAYGPLTYEILTKVGETYTIEASYTIPSINYMYGVASYRFREWIGTIGVKYIRIRTYTRILIGEYITSQDNYRSVELYDYPALVSSLESYDDTHDLRRVDSKPNRAEASLSAGYKLSLVKTAEYMYSDIINRIDEIADPFAVSAGNKVFVSKIAEYWYTDIINIIDNMTDPSGVSAVSAVSAGYKIAYSIESLPIT